MYKCNVNGHIHASGAFSFLVICSARITKIGLQKSGDSLRGGPSITHCGRPTVAQTYTALHPASQLSSASSVPMRKSHLLHEAPPPQKKTRESKRSGVCAEQRIALRARLFLRSHTKAFWEL